MKVQNISCFTRVPIIVLCQADKLSKMKKVLIAGTLILSSLALNAQTITIGFEQADLLEINTGNDTVICKTHTVVLGAAETAIGGSGEYFYSWYPNVFLDDHTSANPNCTPEETTTYMLTVTDKDGCSAIDYVTVAIDPCLGIGDIELNENLIIYPNPVGNKLNISGLPANAEEISLKILNQIGQVVFEKNLYSHGESLEINLNESQEIPPGIYVMHIRYGTQVIVKAIHKI